MPKHVRTVQAMWLACVACVAVACNDHCADEVECEDTMRVGHNHDGRRVFVDDCADRQDVCEVVDEDHAVCVAPTPLLVCGWLEGACLPELGSSTWSLLGDGTCMHRVEQLSDDMRRCLYYSDCSELDRCRR